MNSREHKAKACRQTGTDKSEKRKQQNDTAFNSGAFKLIKLLKLSLPATSKDWKGFRTLQVS